MYGFFLSEKLDGICISPFVCTYTLEDIDFITNFPSIKILSIQQGCQKIDITGIEKLQNLKKISLPEINYPLDYSIFPRLEEIRNTWHPSMKITEDCKKLKSLYLRQYKPKSKNLAELPYLENMESLEFVHGNLVSLEGIGKFTKLKHLALYYISKLASLGEIETLKLKKFELGNCKKIADFEQLAEFETLERLLLNDAGEIPSISFIEKMPNLKQFAFVGTNILDGDMTPCLNNSSLRDVSFTSKKHFSHTLEEMKKLLSPRKQL